MGPAAYPIAIATINRVMITVRSASVVQSARIARETVTVCFASPTFQCCDDMIYGNTGKSSGRSGHPRGRLSEHMRWLHFNPTNIVNPNTASQTSAPKRAPHRYARGDQHRCCGGTCRHTVPNRGT
jgi:hypothetical protein